MLTTYDLFHLARYLNRAIEEVMNDYIVLVYMCGVGYPFLTIKTKPHGDVCVFYKNGCSVQNAKPLACKLYPLNIEPGPHDGLNYCLVSRKTHHYTGETRRVADWMAENLTSDDRRFMIGWFSQAVEHGRAIRRIKKKAESEEEYKQFMLSVLWLMYFCFNPQHDFWPQYERNIALLSKLLKLASE
jgi:Fe-S-cluster containining protein